MDASQAQLSDRRRSRTAFLFSPMKPLHNLYFAMALLVVSLVLPLVVPDMPGTAFAGGALGVLFAVALQLREAEAEAEES